MKRQVDATAYLSGKISLHLLRGTGTFSIGLDRKFRRGEHRALQFALMQNQDQPLGDKKDGTREKQLSPLSFSI